MKKSLTLIFIIMFLALIKIHAQEIWDGTIDATWYNTTQSEFEISKAEELAGLVALVNGGNDFEGKTIKLTSDILLNDDNGWQDWNAGTTDLKEWTPIGSQQYKFEGTFDAQNHNIKGLFIGNTAGAMFGYLGWSGIIKNLNIINGCIAQSNSAALILTNTGIIENCSTNIAFAGETKFAGIALNNQGSIENCTNNCVIENAQEAGGLVYSNEATGSIQHCINYGNLTNITQYAGGIVQINNGFIEYCENKGNILSTVANSRAGGIAAQNFGQIYKCVNSANISAATAGGIAGRNSGTFLYDCSQSDDFKYAHGIVACINDGEISGSQYVGGIAGENTQNRKNYVYYYGLIAYSFNLGMVTYTGQDSESYKTSAICGYQSSNSSNVVRHCYYLQGTAQGGVNGSDKYGIAEPKTLEQFKSGEACHYLNGRSSNDVYFKQNIGTDTYPVLDDSHSTVYAEGSCSHTITSYNNTGDEVAPHTFSSDGICTICGKQFQPANQNSDGVYEIDNAGKLYWFRSLVNGERDYADFIDRNRSASAILLNDIELNDCAGSDNWDENTSGLRAWESIGKAGGCGYSGIFDGNNFSVKGLYFSGKISENGSFVSTLLAGGVIKNLTISDGYIKVILINRSAAFVSSNYGTIDNCENSITVVGGYDYAGGIAGYNENTGKIINCRNKGTIVSTRYTGGIAGYTTGSIQDCQNFGNITSTSIYTGGIAGYMKAGISRCSNYGTITGKTMVGGITGQSDTYFRNCYNEGAVLGKNNLGGIVGNMFAPNVINCLNMGTISASGTNAGGIGGQRNEWPSNCYYYKNCGDKDTIGGASKGIAVCDEMLVNGKTCWYLQNGTANEPWGQKLGIDKHPVLNSGDKVYRIAFLLKDDGFVLMEKFGNSGDIITLPTQAELGCTNTPIYTDVNGNPVTEAFAITEDVSIFAECDIYSINIAESIINGTLSIADYKANAGNIISTKVTAASGYEFNNLVLGYGGETHTIKSCFFEMPASDISLTATFRPILENLSYKITAADNNVYNVLFEWSNIEGSNMVILRDGSEIYRGDANNYTDENIESGTYKYETYLETSNGIESTRQFVNVYVYEQYTSGIEDDVLIPLGDTPITVYDDGGSNADYSQFVSSKTIITAQENCRIKISGDYSTEYRYDTLRVIDSNDEIISYINGKGELNPAIISSGNTMTLHFETDADYTNYGFNFKVETVYPTPAANLTGGRIYSTPEWALSGEEITLSVEAAEGYDYVEGTLKVYKADDPTVTIPLAADNSFIMPAYKVGVTADFNCSTDIIETYQNNYILVTSHNTLQIYGTDKEAQIYDTAGNLVYSGYAREIQLPAGVYIVRIADETQKAIVR